MRSVSSCALPCSAGSASCQTCAPPRSAGGERRPRLVRRLRHRGTPHVARRQRRWGTQHHPAERRCGRRPCRRAVTRPWHRNWRKVGLIWGWGYRFISGWRDRFTWIRGADLGGDGELGRGEGRGKREISGRKGMILQSGSTCTDKHRCSRCGY